MRWAVASLARLSLVLAGIAVTALVLLPQILARVAPFPVGGGPRVPCFPGQSCGRTLAAAYSQPLEVVILEAARRSLALLLGAALLAFVVGILAGAVIAAFRHRAWRSGLMLGGIGLVAALPSFFVAYFLQIAIVFLGGAVGRTLLPVFGFGVDSHIVLPLLALSLPAVAVTAQLAATRFADVLDADFVRTANAKGLWPSWILRVHVLPHVLPLALESVGSGLRIAVASLPIVEYLFVWNGLGYVAIQAMSGRDVEGLTACLVILAGLFALAGVLADGRRLRVT